MAKREELFDWRLEPFVARARIDCDKLFEFQCPKIWGDLEQTRDRTKRFCTECQRTVHLVTSAEQLRTLAQQKACVALIQLEELPDPDMVLEEDRPMLLGKIA